jgi:hypothetical protein
MGLDFGYNQGLPEGVTAAFGARLIAKQDGYLDFLHDRTGTFGSEEEKADLFEWINRKGATAGHPLQASKAPFNAARDRASELLKGYEMRTREAGHFVLYEDGEGVVVGNTNASAGYLYMAAFLKAHVPAGVS